VPPVSSGRFRSAASAATEAHANDRREQPLMDRNTLIRWVVIAAAILLIWKFVIPAVSGKKDGAQNVPAETYANAPGFVGDVVDPPPAGTDANKPAEGEICTIHGNRFDADLSTRGAAVTHFMLRDSQYAGTNGFDMSTTPDIERWRSLRTLFRTEGANDQFKYDRFDWKLERIPNDKGCIFTYADADVSVTKKVLAGERPFELTVETEVKNLANAPKKHELQTEVFAFRKLEDVKGSWGRPSSFQTELSCAAKDVTRKGKDDFHDGWVNVPGVDRYAALNTSYFTEAIIPQGEAATCSLLAEDWLAPGQARDDDKAPLVFHARLSYAPKELAPGQTATYKQTAFFGPKERVVLEQAGGGAARLQDVVNLGFFSPVARFLTGVLEKIHSFIGNWGISIIAMTILLKLVLFPLTWKSIKSSIEMRKLRPEIDVINKRFKDDMQAKNLAMMELWKQHGMGPLGPMGGCLPQLVQMPVWFAMYTTLQTTVQMYHTHFLWFQDLSAPDKYFIMPVLLGLTNIVQMRIVPQQPGMDPMQQKMMNWMMPAIFFVMMLFLPAALGVYMMTNGLLNITQQLLIEKFAPRNPPPAVAASGKSQDSGKSQEKRAKDKRGEIVVKSSS
jgi:YidC/Oxa1 family membrane protein insertase